MRKPLAIFLLLLTLLQSSWAIAAEYCTHLENVTASQHFGHHQHQHPVTDAGADNGVQSDVDTTPNQSHSDNCHHHSVAGLVDTASHDFHGIPDTTVRWHERASDPSPFISHIERPNWAGLA